MKRKLLSWALVLAWVLISSQLYSQNTMDIAIKQFDLEAYQLSIENFKKVIDQDPDNYDAKIRLAKAYQLSNQDDKALEVYEKIAKSDFTSPQIMLQYGLLLKSQARYSEAKEIFKTITESDEATAELLINGCELAEQLQVEPAKYQVKSFEQNSKQSDFAPHVLDNNLVFASFRKDLVRSGEKKNKSLIYIQGNQLFNYNLDSEFEDTDIRFFRGDLKSSYHNGPIAYAGDESNLVAITKNNIKDGYKHIRSDDTHMSLFIGEKTENGDYINERPFPYNETGYSTGFACFADSGSMIYFASNRPGGYGGYDLYVSYLIGEKWSIPVNLGKNVNTSGNEITPYFDEKEDKLYFSSDFHAGLGGFDVFSALKTGELDYNNVENLGRGINSERDDYYLVVNEKTKEFYFASNRGGGKGNDDIYIAELISEGKTELPAVAVQDVIPEAIDLNEMAVPSSSLENTNLVALNTSAQEDYTADNYFSLMDARMIAKHDIILAVPPTKVYFIQVAALYKKSSNVGVFNELTALGNLYKVYKTNSTKIRVGYFYKKEEADKILSKVKSMGYSDAFIVHEPLMTSELELLGNSVSDDPSTISSTFRPANSVSNYKVRLASYTDPLWFDISRVNDLGEIEQWTKGQYTIFILSGYGSLDNARQAMIKAKNRGFTEAHIVVDNNGFLEKLMEN